MPHGLILKKESTLAKPKLDPRKKLAKKSGKKLDKRRNKKSVKPLGKPVKKPMEKSTGKPFDKKTIERFRKILLKEREQIIGDVKQINESSKEMGQDGIQDIGDEAANIYNKQILLTLNENERW